MSNPQYLREACKPHPPRLLGFQTAWPTQRQTQGARRAKRGRRRTPPAERRKTKDFPTRSQNSKLTSCDNTEKQCGTRQSRCRTVHPSGTSRLDVKTNYFRSPGLFQKYSKCKMGCYDIGSYNRRTTIYKSPDGRR